MKKVIFLSLFMLSTMYAFTQVAINKDGSDPDPNSILHVKGSSINALYVDHATGNVGLNSIIPFYRLHVLDAVTDAKTYGTVFEITGGSTSTSKYAGVYTYINGTGGVNRAYEGLSYGANSSSYNIGLSGFARNGKFNYGVQGWSTEANIITYGLNVGGNFEADNCDYQNIGVWTIAYGGASYSTGVYAQANENNPGTNYGIYAEGDNGGIGGGDYWSGYFDGKMNVDGAIYQNGSVLHSKSFSAISNASEKVMNISPVSFINEEDETSFGFDAETMKEAYPELVKDVMAPPAPGEEQTEPEIKSSVNISAILPILTKAIQELNERMKVLEAENNALKGEINKLKSE